MYIIMDDIDIHSKIQKTSAGVGSDRNNLISNCCSSEKNDLYATNPEPIKWANNAPVPTIKSVATEPLLGAGKEPLPGVSIPT